MANLIAYELLPRIFNMSVTAGIVILFVLLARLLLRRAPKVFSYALWSVVLFRLLCPVSLSAGFSLLGLVDMPTRAATPHTTTVEYVPPDIVHAEDPQVQFPVEPVRTAVNEVLPKGEEQTTADPLEAPMAIATWLWLLGILAMAAYSVASYLKIRRRLVGAVPLRDNIYLADHIPTPFVMGLFRPRIYLPSALSGREQAYIIRHEQHHIRRGDHIVKVLSFAALCIHWFNPLVWAAFFLSGKDMEMSCDEAVVHALGEQIRADYSTSLLRLATGRRRIAGMPLAFGEGDTKSRIRNLVSWKTPKRWAALLAAVVCIAVAAACAWMAFRSGWQAAMMAPTEILAEQHCRSLSALLAPAGMRVGLLTGSMRAGEKKRVYAALEAGEIDFVVGTHALLSGPVAFRRLGLVVADEQHRFGVEQRAALAAKANTPDCPPEAGRRLCGEGRGDSVPPAANGMDGVPTAACRCGEVEQRAALAAKGEKKIRPHVLVMSATPIPRTLALIIYGDLDVSVIDQLPPGRLPVKTVLVGESKRQRMYGFVREQIRQGRQAYIVCPAIETDPESAAADLKRVVEYAEGLQKQVFPDLRVGLVHGRMKAKDKDAAMAAFARGETHILVSTTVVEVGVDVANATLMIVENADRYGLSQLHQLRGRVGRGEHQSWCVLVSDNRSPETRARLKVLVDTADGFRIAEEDLKLRGPGDFFGRRQHGLPALRMADLNTDTRVLKEARDAAAALLSADPDLSRPEHRPLLEKVRRLFQENPDMFN